MLNLRSSGLWLFSGGVILLLLENLAEFLYPGYSVSKNMISDLGVGPSTPMVLFTSGVIAFGLMAIIASLLIREEYRHSWIWLPIGLSGVGAIGVGLFNENWIPEIHVLFAFLAFFFGNLASIWSYRLVRRPFSFFCVILGVVGIAALALTGADADLGLGPGGMERMIFYPAMIWALGVGAWLMSAEQSQGRANRT